MSISDLVKKWAIAIFALITSLGLLVAFAVPKNIAWILLTGLGVLQFLLIWIRGKVVRIFYQNQHLQSLHEREIYFIKQIMKDIDYGITFFDESDRFIYINQAYTHSTGMTSTEFKHIPFESLPSNTHQFSKSKPISSKKE